jgi:hypothetical protein
VVGWCLEWFLEDEGRRRGFETKREIGVFGWPVVSGYGGEWPEVVSRWWGFLDFREDLRWGTEKERGRGVRLKGENGENGENVT